MTHRSIEELLDARRLAGLTTTPGGRIVATVSAPDAKGTAYRTSLVEMVDGALLPLTRGSASVGSLALAEDGTALFTAKRVGEDGEEGTRTLWSPAMVSRTRWGRRVVLVEESQERDVWAGPMIPC